MKDLDFYFDFSSPFAYLGAMSIQDVARRAGARLVWRPMFLGGLFKAIGTPTVPLMTLSPAKQRYVQIDLQRWADYRGLPLKWPSRFPMMTITPLRMTVALLDQGHDPWPLWLSCQCTSYRYDGGCRMNRSTSHLVTGLQK